MRIARRTVALGVLSALACFGRAVRADAPTPERVDRAAERVWWAFAGGIAPPEEEGRNARKILEDHAATLSEGERTKARLRTDPFPVMLAKAAWAAGDRDEGTARAKAVLATLDRMPLWDRGNVLHEMHVLLGRIALERGDPKEAGAQLLESSKTSGSPQLASFGPDWTLAQDLLAKGEREVVVAYIDAVGRFWESGGDRLAAWKKEVGQGKNPTFVPHRDGNVPSPPKPEPFPPSLETPKGVLGVWESTSTSRGGIGHAAEFHADGTVRMAMLILHQGRYRVEGDRLVIGDGENSESGPLGKIENDRWTVEADGTKVVKKRVGTAVTGQPAIVGVWTYSVDENAKAYERFRADGWLEYRMPMATLATGRYEKAGDMLRLKLEGALALEYQVVIEGDRLRVTAVGEVREYRFAGEKPWYPLATPR
jgi:hypothetical protein